MLRVRDVASGRDLPDMIPCTRACSLEWLPDASGFFYTRYPEPGDGGPGEENYHRRVFEHVLGADWREDALVFEPREPEDWPSVHLSPDGRFLAVSVSQGLDAHRRLPAGPLGGGGLRDGGGGRRRPLRRDPAQRSPLPAHQQRRAPVPAAGRATPSVRPRVTGAR